MFAKRFFYVCAGLLCLALAYHLGARSANAQKAATPQVAAAWVFPGSGQPFVVTTSGDVYRGDTGGGNWVRTANVFTP